MVCTCSACPVKPAQYTLGHFQPEAAVTVFTTGDSLEAQAALGRWLALRHAIASCHALTLRKLAATSLHYSYSTAAASAETSSAHNSAPGDQLTSQPPHSSAQQTNTGVSAISLPVRALQAAISPAVCTALQREGFAVRRGP